ncbi:MAG: ACP S-malonyltransferase [Nanoarchaeota archaeon]|nr:ACP S-malonyltransferase [Nanoarchaeota archaeon]
MKPNAIIAPGQSAQYVGMGSDLVSSKNQVINDITGKIYQKANEILGFDLMGICFNGPKESLDKTLVTQPAVLVHSIACYEVFKALYKQSLGEEFDFAVAAGASLGEYFALYSAGVLDYERVLSIVQKRAIAMTEVINQPGYDAGRQLLLNVEAATLDDVCAQFGLEQSNCNIGGKRSATVVGGAVKDVDAAIEYLHATLKGAGVSLMVIPLPTEAAFHTSLMTPARRKFAPVVSSYEFLPFQRNVVSNCTGQLYAQDGSDIRINLIHQIDSPVRWLYGMRTIMKELSQLEGNQAIFEFGGGKPTETNPANQRGNFGGTTRKNLTEMGINPKDISLYDCVSERTILETIDKLRQDAGR